MNLSRDNRPEEELQGKFSNDMLSWLSSDIAGLSLYFANPGFFLNWELRIITVVIQPEKEKHLHETMKV